MPTTQAKRPLSKGSQNWAPAQTLHFAKDGAYTLRFPTEVPVKIVFQEFDHATPVAPSYHDFLELMVVHEGSGLLYAEGECHPISAGDVAIIGPNEFHRIEAPSRDRLRLAAIHFHERAAFVTGSPEVDFEYVRPFLARGGAFRRVFRLSPQDRGEIWEATVRMEGNRTQGALGALAVRTELLNLLLKVAERSGPHLKGSQLIGGRQHQLARLRPAIDQLRLHFGERPNFRTLAQSAHLSTAHFSRLFKKVVGLTPTAFLTRCRIDGASHLLANHAIPLSEVALRTGFCSQSHFSATFRALKGISPLAYRQQQPQPSSQ